MFRTIVMFPASADEAEVDELVARTAAAFTKRRTFRGMTTNDGPLMGPSAKRREFGRVFEADFDELDDLLEALGADDFREVRAATEALEPALLVLELRDL